jgi:hypothetical protein
LILVDFVKNWKANGFLLVDWNAKVSLLVDWNANGSFA